MTKATKKEIWAGVAERGIRQREDNWSKQECWFGKSFSRNNQVVNSRLIELPLPPLSRRACIGSSKVGSGRTLIQVVWELQHI